MLRWTHWTSTSPESQRSVRVWNTMRNLWHSDCNSSPSLEELLTQENYVNLIIPYGRPSLIGHFGLGFYSAFMVAKKVEIDTLSYQEGATPVHWSCDGSPEFELTDSSPRGMFRPD